MKLYRINPVPKPRMTRKDKWNPSEAAQRYFAYRDEVRLHKVTIPEADYHVVFVLPMPDSWSGRKKARYIGSGHQQKPDKDNLEKGLLDAVYGDDCVVWDGRATKMWGNTGAIIVSNGTLNLELVSEFIRNDFNR